MAAADSSKTSSTSPNFSIHSAVVIHTAHTIEFATVAIASIATAFIHSFSIGGITNTGVARAITGQATDHSMTARSFRVAICSQDGILRHSELHRVSFGLMVVKTGVEVVRRRKGAEIFSGARSLLEKDGTDPYSFIQGKISVVDHSSCLVSNTTTINSSSLPHYSNYPPPST